MEAAEVVPGLPPRVLASDREVTRLGESVFRGGAVGEDAPKATCVVLARIAALYSKHDVVGVRVWDRVIATSATASAVARAPRARRDAIDRRRVSTAERAGEAFQQIYNRPISVVKAKE
jgi:exopolyphosphatase/guanosine-5'-triphosphate,3'-diphosphate pyrophosphatase